MRRYLLCLALSLMPLPAVAQEGLDDLIPLIELYGPGGSAPAFDVAGIRCAGMFAAQDAWGQANGTPRPSRREMQTVENNLAAAFQQRQNDGVDIVRAQTSVEADFFRVMELYEGVFAANARRGGRWDDGALIAGDRTYCGFLNQ